MGKAKHVTYGVAFFWFVIATMLLGLIIAAWGAARDVVEDWNDA